MDMEPIRSESAKKMLQDCYSAIKSVVLQLIYLFLKLIRTPGGFDERRVSKVDNNLVASVSKLEKDGKIDRKLKGLKDIPGPRALPFVGTLLTSPALESKDLMKSNEDRMKKYGSLVKEELYWNFPMINILDADDIEVAIKNVGTFRPGMEIINVYRTLRPDRYDSLGLVNSSGKDWEKLHKATISLISSPKYINSMTIVADQIALDFTLLLDNSCPVVNNFDHLLKKYIAETTNYTVFGKRSGFLDESNTEVNILFEVHETYWGAFHESAYGYPWWKYFSTNIWKRFVKAEDALLDLTRKSIQDAIDDGDAQGILEGLLKCETISENDKVLVCLEFMTGGSEPVLATAILLLHFLSNDTDVSRRIYEELKIALPFKDSPIDEDTLDHLPYLKACIMETQRICPTAPMLARISEQPVQIGDYNIPAYTLIVLHNLYAASQEKSFYRAKEFLPQRWIYSDGVPPYQPHRRNLMMDFGVGKRACPGRRAATLHLTILMARLFRKYEIQFERKMELEFMWLNRPKLPVTIGFYERLDD